MTTWRKSSRSGGTTIQSDCVEVARLGDAGGTIGLRDSKNPAAGHLSVPVAAFAALVTRVKRDDLHRR